MKPWERRPGEGTKAYADFQKYLELGSDRTVKKLSEIYGKSVSHYVKLSGTFNWVKRTQQWDDFKTEQERISQLEDELKERRNARRLRLAVQSKVLSLTLKELSENGVKKAKKAGFESLARSSAKHSELFRSEYEEAPVEKTSEDLHAAAEKAYASLEEFQRARAAELAELMKKHIDNEQ